MKNINEKIIMITLLVMFVVLCAYLVVLAYELSLSKSVMELFFSN